MNKFDKSNEQKRKLRVWQDPAPTITILRICDITNDMCYNHGKIVYVHTCTYVLNICTCMTLGVWGGGKEWRTGGSI